MKTANWSVCMDVFGIKLFFLRLSPAFRIIALYEESGSMSMYELGCQRLRFPKPTTSTGRCGDWPRSVHTLKRIQFLYKICNEFRKSGCWRRRLFPAKPAHRIRPKFLFDYILDSITGCDPESTDYVLLEPARCPACGAELHTGAWRWTESEGEGPTAFILPSTLVTLKNERQ
jgi:hypothetical protein